MKVLAVVNKNLHKQMEETGLNVRIEMQILIQKSISSLFVFVWNISKVERCSIPVANRKTLIANLVLMCSSELCDIEITLFCQFQKCHLELEAAFTLTCQRTCTQKAAVNRFYYYASLCVPCLTEETHISPADLIWHWADVIVVH